MLLNVRMMSVCWNLSVKQEIGKPCRLANAQEQSDGSERSPTVMLNSLSLLLERKGESKTGQQRGLFTSYGIKEK